MARNWQKILRPLGLTFARRPDGTPGARSRYASGPYTLVSDALDSDIDELRRRIERLEKGLGQDRH